MKKFIAGLLLVLVVATGVQAQEVTVTPEEPTPVVVDDGSGGVDTIVVTPEPLPEPEPEPEQDADRTEAVLLGVVVVLSIFAALLLGTVLMLARAGFEAAPSWVKDLILTNRGYILTKADELGTDLERRAALTPNTLDDQLAAYFHANFNRALVEFFQSAEGTALVQKALGPQG